jgi:hypothetical protein
VEVGGAAGTPEEEGDGEGVGGAARDDGLSSAGARAWRRRRQRRT